METLAPLLFKFPAAWQKPSSPPLAAWSRAQRSMPGVAPHQLCPTYPGKAAAPERRWDGHSSTAPLWILPPCAGCACLTCILPAWSRTGKEGNTSLLNFFFFFFSKKCILSSLILLNSLVNGLLSGWETAHITQFTSSFWKSSPQSQHSIQKKYNRLCYNSPLCMAHRFGMQIPWISQISTTDFWAFAAVNYEMVTDTVNELWWLLANYSYSPQRRLFM